MTPSKDLMDRRRDFANVTNPGHHHTEFFRNVLRWMRLPVTGKLLNWEWIVGYFHVCGYVTKLAEAIFGEGEEASSWANKTRRWLKSQPNGTYRVLTRLPP